MQTPTNRSRVVKLSLLLVILTCAAMGRVVTNDFVNWDDQETIYENPHLHPVTISSLKVFWSKPQGQLFIPLTYTVWAGIATISHSPAAFHAASLLLHIAAALVVFATLRLLVQNDVAAFFGAAIFAVHPVQVEAVAWASGFKDVLSGLLGFTGVYFVARVFNPCVSRSHGLKTRATKELLFANAFFILAMLAKPSAVVMPVVATWIACWMFGARLRELARWLIIPLLCGVAITIVTAKVQPAPEAPRIALWARPLVAADAITFYFTKLVAPIRLGIDYGRSPDVVIAKPIVYFTSAILVVFIALVISRRRRNPMLVAGVGAFVIALLPVLGLAPFDFQKYSTVTDHYLYPAMLGVALLFAALVAKTRLHALAAAVIVGLAIVSFIQMGNWRNSQTLFTHALEVNPRSYAAHNVLGFLEARSGDPNLAVAHYRAVLELHPGDNAARLNLANLLTRRAIALEQNNQFDKAEADLRNAMALDPENPDRLRNLETLMRHREKASP